MARAQKNDVVVNVDAPAGETADAVEVMLAEVPAASPAAVNLVETVDEVDPELVITLDDEEDIEAPDEDADDDGEDIVGVEIADGIYKQVFAVTKVISRLEVVMETLGLSSIVEALDAFIATSVNKAYGIQTKSGVIWVNSLNRNQIVRALSGHPAFAEIAKASRMSRFVELRQSDEYKLIVSRMQNAAQTLANLTSIAENMHISIDPDVWSIIDRTSLDGEPVEIKGRRGRPLGKMTKGTVLTKGWESLRDGKTYTSDSAFASKRSVKNGVIFGEKYSIRIKFLKDADVWSAWAIQMRETKGGYIPMEGGYVTPVYTSEGDSPSGAVHSVKNGILGHQGQRNVRDMFSNALR